MNNELKFQHIKRLWYLEGSVIKTRHGNRPIKFRLDRKGYLATASELRRISRQQNTSLWRAHI